MKLSQDQYKGLIRHFLTFVGGCLITLGYIDVQSLESVLGGIMTLVGIVMSAMNKKRAEPDDSALSDDTKSDVIADSDD